MNDAWPTAYVLNVVIINASAEVPCLLLKASTRAKPQPFQPPKRHKPCTAAGARHGEDCAAPGQGACQDQHPHPN